MIVIHGADSHSQRGELKSFRRRLFAPIDLAHTISTAVRPVELRKLAEPNVD
jgi:hypothetical protein